MESEDELITRLSISSSPSVQESSAGHPHSAVSKYGYPTLAALSNPVILKSAFGYLDLYSLYSCKEVCSVWSSIAQPIMSQHRDSYLCLPNCSTNNWEKVPELVVKSWVDAGLKTKTVNYKISPLGSTLPLVLDKIKGEVKSLHLIVDLLERSNCQIDSFSNIKFVRLKSLRLESTYSSFGMEQDAQDRIKQNTLVLLEIIRRSPNLQQISLSWMPYRWTRIFLDTLLGPEGLPGNERFKEILESMKVSTTRVALNQSDIEALQRMNLKLKMLELELSEVNCQGKLSLWLKDLSRTLESLSLVPHRGWNSYKLFSVQMKMLKSLRIQNPQYFGVDDIIWILERLPKLESLTLTGATSTLVKLDDYVAGILDNVSFPNLKEFRISKYTFKELDVQPSAYIPKLFPNLKKVRMNVYSRNTFLAGVHELKDMMIVELELQLETTRNEAERDRTVFWRGVDGKVPSLTDWKRLRKLTLIHSFMSYGRPGTVYDIPMEEIVPASLTSLEIKCFKMVDSTFLIKLLKGLPRLMQLNVSGTEIVDVGRGRSMNRSAFTDKIMENPFIHPYLRIYFD